MRQDSTDFIQYFSDRFGVEESIWEPFLIRIGNRSVHLVAGSLPDLSWNIEDRGFRIASLTTRSFKPATRGLQWLGDRIVRNRVEVERSKLEKLLQRETVAVSGHCQFTRGYVALCYRKIVLGCGFWTGDVLRTQVSKAQTREFPRAELT